MPAKLVDVVNVQDALKKELVPGKVLAASLLDPATKTIMLRAGTVLTPGLIRLLHRTHLAGRALSCIADGAQQEAGDRPERARQPSGTGRQAGPSPEFEEARLRRRRLHQALASLRLLLAAVAIGAGTFGWLFGSRLDLDAALAGAALLLAAFVASFHLAGRTRIILQNGGRAPATKIRPNLAGALTIRTAPAGESPPAQVA